jgi:MFS transporter, OFA family, oxalate/formate antiporter
MMPEAPMGSGRRWPVAVAGVVTQLILGTVYAWSVFKKPLMAAHGWSGPEVGLTFTFAIFCIGAAAAVGGRLVDRAGARRVAQVAAVMFGVGTILAGAADAVGSKWLLWAGYGFIGGCGNGLGYVTPIAVLVRWFPERRGTITGLAVMGFGLGAAIMGQVAPLLILRMGVASTLCLSGAIFLVVLLAAARYLVNPTEAQAARLPQPVAKGGEAVLPAVDFQAARRMYQFYLLWAILFINVTAGIALISNLSPMAQAQLGLSAIAAGSLVFVSSVFNGLGRICWASLSDRLGRQLTFLLILGTQIPVFAALPRVHDQWLFGALCCYILFCYGGGFATMPAFAVDTFGTRNIGSIYGPILFAWGVAGVVGPLLMEFVHKTSGSFGAALLIAAGFLGLGFVLTALYRKPSHLHQTRPDPLLPAIAGD